MPITKTKINAEKRTATENIEKLLISSLNLASPTLKPLSTRETYSKLSFTRIPQST